MVSKLWTFSRKCEGFERYFCEFPSKIRLSIISKPPASLSHLHTINFFPFVKFPQLFNVKNVPRASFEIIFKQISAPKTNFFLSRCRNFALYLWKVAAHSKIEDTNLPRSKITHLLARETCLRMFRRHFLHAELMMGNSSYKVRVVGGEKAQGDDERGKIVFLIKFTVKPGQAEFQPLLSWMLNSANVNPQIPLPKHLFFLSIFHSSLKGIHHSSNLLIHTSLCLFLLSLHTAR